MCVHIQEHTHIIARNHYSQMFPYEGALNQPKMGHHGLFLTTGYNMWLLDISISISIAIAISISISIYIYIYIERCMSLLYDWCHDPFAYVSCTSQERATTCRRTELPALDQATIAHLLDHKVHQKL